jgi:hypothetical protein
MAVATSALPAEHLLEELVELGKGRSQEEKDREERYSKHPGFICDHSVANGWEM